jgi:excisionase family DNA binding protein
MGNGRDPTGKRSVGDPTVVACVVFQTRDPEELVQMLRQALTGIADQVPAVPPGSPAPPLQRDSEDPWFKHAEAAEYLGISKSTLYQYTCQRKIEFRKLGGRLEYRRSTLDQFKDQQISPSRQWFSQRSIMAAALGSGK